MYFKKKNLNIKINKYNVNIQHFNLSKPMPYKKIRLHCIYVFLKKI